MQRLIFILTLSLLFAGQVRGQVSKEQLKGVWGIAAMGKIGHDTVIILNRDTAIAAEFPNHVFAHIADKIYGSKSPGEMLAYTVLGMFSNMFLQFDAVNIFGEGMKPEMPDEKPSVKRGTYLLSGDKLQTKTKKTEHFDVAFKGGYLVLTSETGSVMYLKKFRDELY